VLLVLLYLSLQTGVVQNYLVRQAANTLSKALHTEVKVAAIDFKFFNQLQLKGTLVKDLQKDTLLYAGELNVNITDWFFFKDKIELQHIGLNNAVIYAHRRDSVWNYQFLVDYFSAPASSKKSQPINLVIKTIDLQNIRLMQHDEWRGENLGLSLHQLYLETDEFNLTNRVIRIKNLLLDQPVFSIYNYDGKRPALGRRKSDTIPANDKEKLRWNSGHWIFAVDDLTIKNGAFRNDVFTERKPYYYFDGAHFQFGAINGHFSKVQLQQDTITAIASLSTRERSGFEVKKMTANIRFFPEAMEFNNLDLRTAKSHLKNYFAMRYSSFDNMSSFIEKVRMQGVFTNAIIHSDDIAFFAPELKQWDKRLFITGKVSGSVNNLTGKNLNVRAGANTSLIGEFSLMGLPDINKAYLDFTAKDFKTTYGDLVKIIPQIGTITEPRLDRLEYLHFKGNFTGFFRDFVTYGNIETALGSIRTDINMKIPVKGTPQYKGTISTENFNLGKFINTPAIGSLAFTGDIKGKGFTLSTLDAKLNGSLPFIEYNNYRYNEIAVDGQLAKRLFNGNIAVNDEHLEATLKGLVDLSGKVPRFDFNALVNNANLHNLHFTKDEVDVNGLFKVNFVGNNFDNFIGDAKVSEASVFKNGQRISFDSLYVQSSLQSNGNKTISVKSNEFEGVLAGEFNISSLPDAFQTFLNRYYPSYIAASKKKVSNNFSFFITTRKVDDYLDLLDKNLKGFNYSTINGKVNTRENIFDIDAEVPQFAYNKIGFYDTKFQGRGTYDSLSVATTIGDVFVNDSLHFPGTNLTVKASNDLSQVNIITSANQTLNRANISGEVQTLKNGVRILFNPSSFDINNKQWTIDKGGELILSRELVTTDGVRIYSGEQEVLVSSSPSSIGKGNDLKIDLKKINIGDFTPFFVKSNRIEGLLSGTIDVVDPFGNLHVDASAKAEQFRFDNDSIGVLDLTTSYARKSGKINFKTISANEGYNFDVAGLVNTADSLSDDIDINTNFNQTKIDILQQYLTGIFSKVEGKATGNLRIKGKANNLKYLGDVSLLEGGLLVDYTKVYYKIPAAQVKFSDGLIDFGHFQFTDTLGNKGELTDGRLYHNNFKDMAFDFKVNTDQLLLLNTTGVDNKLFYGSVIGKANMSFTGPGYDMTMDVSGAPTDSSKIYIATGTGRESADADYIVWKKYGKEMEDFLSYNKENNLTVSLDINANNKATVYLIIDEQTGDIIQARGSGNLKMRTGTRENFTMNGRYEIESGYYNFNFQAWKKTFKLLPDKGNSIFWNGNPYEAALKIDAMYEAENVRFSDLLSSGGFDIITDNNVRQYRGKVNVLASITDKLTAPKIKFQIELPENSPIRNNSSAQTLISTIQRDENELNKQVSYLILFNSFGPLTAAGSVSNNSGAFANAAFEGLVVNSISGFLSSVLTNEFSKLLQTVFNDKSLKVNLSASLYSGTNITGQNNTQISLPDRTNINLSVGKSFLDERLSFVVGSAIDFGIGAQQASTFQFLPDVTAEYKLTPDGKFRITFFYRNNWSYIAQNALQRSGVSLSYRKEFDRINELGKKKRRKQEAVSSEQ
jgi:TamB, inner membrane protein subunit of TAM complex